MQIKVILIRMVSHLDSLLNRGIRELGNGLLNFMGPWFVELSPKIHSQISEQIFCPVDMRHNRIVRVEALKVFNCSYDFAIFFVLDVLSNSILWTWWNQLRQSPDSLVTELWTPVLLLFQSLSEWLVMYRSNRSLLKTSPSPGIPRAFDVFSCPGGREFD